MNFLAIIPARYASTRFPGKPLARLGGKPVIQRVYEQVAGVLDDAVVATDDERIRDAVRVAVPDTAAATCLILAHPEMFTDYEITKGRMDDVFLAVTGKKLNGGGAE